MERKKKTKRKRKEKTNIPEGVAVCGPSSRDSGCNGTELSRSQEIEVVLTGIARVDEDNLSLATGEVMVDATKSAGFAQ